MNFQHILKIPLYLKIVETVYKSSYRLKEIYNYVDHDLYNTLLIIDKK